MAVERESDVPARSAEQRRWEDASRAAALLAIDPAGIGGVALRAGAGPVRDRWLARVQRLLGDQSIRRVPLHIPDNRLLGGLDLAATLRAGRPVAERGLLADSDGGVLLLPMAERLPPETAGRLAAVIDTGEVRVERDGIALQSPARFGVIAFDEGQGDDAPPPAALLDRLGVHADLNAIALRDAGEDDVDPDGIDAARTRLPQVTIDDAQIDALCATALALGIASLRVPLLAMRVARANAALEGRSQVAQGDLELAGRLVLAARAMRLPAMDEDAQPPEAPEEPERNEEPPPSDDDEQQALPDRPLDERVLDAAQAAIPPGLLALLQAGLAPRRHGGTAGRAGAAQASQRRGRPAGTRRGELRAGVRLNVVETLRAAAPWQPLRRMENARKALDAVHRRVESRARIDVRRDDFRITRFKQRSQTTTLFAVDASGSSALHRLAEAKGAVELLLADCYVRRDEVALIAFRNKTAEILLPPTRSLVRAKRALAGLPGGGGTPLAAGLEALLLLAQSEQRRGSTPIAVVLTDGRANIARDGQASRAAGEADALAAARALRVAALNIVLIDTSPRPQGSAAQLAEAMGARYVALPHADARTLSAAVQSLQAS
jgi:magnesium chelatase subunit D